MNNKKFQIIVNELKGRNKLYRRVVSEIVKDSEGYAGKNKAERVAARLRDVAHGCSTGTVTSLIYHRDTCAFFKKYKREIAEIVKEYQDDTGESIADMRWFDKSDMFCEDTHNQNYLAWFAYEAIAWRFDSELETAED